MLVLGLIDIEVGLLKVIPEEAEDKYLFELGVFKDLNLLVSSQLLLS